MNRSIPVLVVLAIATLGVSPVLAEGFYVGAGIGNTFYSSEFSFEEAGDQVQKIDENSTAWKIFGGFSGHKFLGLEGGYRDFGTIETNWGDGTFEQNIKGWDIEALGRIQVAILDIFGKAGVMFWNSDISFDGQKVDDSGTNFLWGLGVGARLGPIGVRLEWESLAISDGDDLSAVSLGATFGF